MASRLIYRAHHPLPDRPAVRLCTTACALVSADRERPGTRMHFAALPNVTIIPLDLEAALRIMPEDGWAFPHTRHSAQPSLDLPLGAVVATLAPRAWAGQPVRVLDLTPAD